MSVIWITGNTGAGKTTVAGMLADGRPLTIVLDGDELREVWSGLGFSEKDRREQNLRAARLAALLNDEGFDVVVATICPYRDLRREVHEITGCRFIYLAGGAEPDEEHPYEAPLPEERGRG